MENRKELIFDIDTNVVEQILGDGNHAEAYSNIRNFIENERLKFCIEKLREEKDDSMAFDIMKLFEDDDYVSPGSIGGKIKRIRELRGLTPKNLGDSCGFSKTTADVRIAQYEKNKKVPREKALNIIAEALEIDDYALFDADMLPYNRMYHALFDIEDFHGLHPVKKEDGYYLEFSGHTILDQDIHKHDFDSFLEKWYEMYQKSLPTSIDTKEDKERKATEYALWRFEYPQNIAPKNDK